MRQGRLPIAEVAQSFLSVEDHACGWFDAEIKPALGIDLYSCIFPTDIGYQLYYNRPQVTLLVMRLEDTNRVAGKAMEDLLGIKGFRLYSYNIGTEKTYASLYKAFKAIPLPVSYVEQAYATKFARHFYTESELRRFARKWTQGRA